jgi:hypothetical protein
VRRLCTFPSTVSWNQPKSSADAASVSPALSRGDSTIEYAVEVRASFPRWYDVPADAWESSPTIPTDSGSIL